MAGTSVNLNDAYRKPRTKRLAAKSSLFEDGALAAAPTDLGFVRRLNTLLWVRESRVEASAREDIASSISKMGALKKYAELCVFGRWLLEDGHPGLKRSRGQQADPRMVLKCVAAGIHGLRWRALRKNVSKNLEEPARSHRKSALTKTDLARYWRELYGVSAEPSLFDARIRSTRRILMAYLDHIDAGKLVEGAAVIRSSSEIRAVFEALSKPQDVAASKSSSSTASAAAPIRATPSPFEAPLVYSSKAREETYRNKPGGAVAASILQYVPEPISSTSASGAIRADLAGRFVVKPVAKIREHYRTSAVVDRIAFLVDTASAVDPRALQKAISKDAGASTYVHDRALGPGDTNWGAPLPALDKGATAGERFAILMQEPTPSTLTRVIRLLADRYAVKDPVTPHMIEVSVDFHPRNPGSPERSIALREEMVGLLQRHHWASHDKLSDGDAEWSRNGDARQIYGEKPGGTLRYLFASSPEDRFTPDRDLKLPEVRRRILTDEPGNQLYLDATLAKGARRSASLVSIQHKIADQRNTVRGTLLTLPQDRRRARMEVTISGSEKLSEQGLTVIGDLGAASFRKLCKPFLSFRIGTVEPWRHLADDAETQMRTRGVYGMELRERARAIEEREKLRGSGVELPRDRDRAGAGLVDWPELNDVVGKALDELGRRWRGFSWP